MDSQIKVFDQKINELVKLGKPKIAFGMKETNKEILESLERGKQYADIVLVGPEEIKDIAGFELIIDENPEEKLATMLVNGEVEGIIRGTIDDFKTYETYQKLAGEKSELNPPLFEDTFSRQFFMSPVSNPEGWEKEERLKIAEGIAEFAKQYGISPKIAVLAAERHDTYPRKKHIREGVVGILNKTYEDAEWLVEKLTEKGYETKNWAIDFNPAIENGYNVVIPVNGMVGNQMFRAMHICGGKILAAPRLGLSRCYEDNSRTERDFDYHVKWLVAWINSKKNNYEH